MHVYDAILSRRSIRKFQQTPISREALEKLVYAASMAAYPANLQPLKFAIVDEKDLLPEVFSCTKWAGYLTDGTPKEDERPVAYIVLLGDTTIKKNTDFQVENGAAGMTILLAAKEMDIATCWLGALDRKKLKELLRLPEHLQVLDLIALGYGAQESCAEEIKDGNVKYYLDREGKLHVPKRPLEEIIL